MPYIPRDTKTILQSMAARVIARTDLTDLAEGSVLLQILASVSEEINASELRLKRIRDSFFLQDVTSAELDTRASEMPPSGLSRRLATHAQGAVMRISRENVPALGGESWPLAFTLEKGAIFRRTDDKTQTYVTTEDAVFAGSPGVGLPGVGSLEDVYVKCQQKGSGGNCAAGTITDIVSAPKEIISVKNQTTSGGGDLQNGVERETDEQLKNRIVAYLSSLARCQPTALEYCALRFVDVNGARATFASVFEDPTHLGYSELVIDDGSGLQGNEVSGGTSSGIVPAHGQAILYHQAPAVGPITRIIIERGGVDIVFMHENDDYISIPERGLVYFPEGVLQPGDKWEIGGTNTSFDVYTNLIASLQKVIEGSTSDPANRPGWRAAGTRVVVRPALSQALTMSIHVIPQQYISLGEVADEIKQECVIFGKTLGPGDTFYVAQLIDKLMNNPKIISLRIYETNSSVFKEDDPAADYKTAFRISANDIAIQPAQEDN